MFCRRVALVAQEAASRLRLKRIAMILSNICHARGSGSGISVEIETDELEDLVSLAVVWLRKRHLG